jgi:hypothetical protein
MTKQQLVVILLPPFNRLLEFEEAAIRDDSKLFLIADQSHVEEFELSDSDNIKLILECCGSVLRRVNRVIHSFLLEESLIFISSGNIVFDNLAFSEMKVCSQLDPFFSFITPRSNIEVAAEGGLVEKIDMSILKEMSNFLPQYKIDTIATSLPIMIRSDMFEKFGMFQEDVDCVFNAVAKLFIVSNRCGYKTIVANRAHMLCDSDSYYSYAYNVNAPPTPDYERGLEIMRNSPDAKKDQFLVNHLTDKEVYKIVVDIRNLQDKYNGTAAYILSLIGPLQVVADRDGVKLTFWVNNDAQAFHDLDSKYASFFQSELLPSDIFHGALRLSQPWGLSDLSDLSERASVNAYVMLDTISWDCFYIRTNHLDALWKTMALFSDGLLFISAYSQERFVKRFKCPDDLKLTDSLCSKNIQDYSTCIVQQDESDTDLGEYILIVGNELHHKYLEETVKDISISFPYLNVKVIGNIKSEYPNVGIFESGMLSEEEVNELYQKCRCVIYPSLYEGFGFPVMKSIANRKPVFARGSDLLSEIINKGRKLNGIYSYRDKYELMQLVHDTIDKKEITDEFSGNEVNSGGDWGWDESAESIISFMKKLIDGYSYKKTEARLDHMHVIKTIR